MSPDSGGKTWQMLALPLAGLLLGLVLMAGVWLAIPLALGTQAAQIVADPARLAELLAERSPSGWPLLLAALLCLPPLAGIALTVGGYQLAMHRAAPPPAIQRAAMQAEIDDVLARARGVPPEDNSSGYR